MERAAGTIGGIVDKSAGDVQTDLVLVSVLGQVLPWRLAYVGV